MIGRRPPLVLIAGATASGKSGLAVALARRIERGGGGAVVINADSAQVYRDLAVLSARPGDAEMQGIDHRLFGYIDGAEACSAARWAADARREIGAAHAEGRTPILVGGTGLYLRTLLDGIAPVPAIDPAVRTEVRALPVAAAHAALAAADPDAAVRLNPGDTTRIARALEVVRATGRPLSAWQAQRQGGIGDTVDLRAIVLLPPREWLWDRCDARFAAMLDGGAPAEVAGLIARGLPAELPVMRAIGVPEVAAWQAGTISKPECLAAGQLATRRYAKRQYTWFRNQPPPDWIRDERIINDEPLDDIATLLRV